MVSVTADWKSIYCPERLILPNCFGVSLAFVVHSLNFTKDQHVSSSLTSELAVDEREREKASVQTGEGETRSVKGHMCI